MKKINSQHIINNDIYQHFSSITRKEIPEKFVRKDIYWVVNNPSRF